MQEGKLVDPLCSDVTTETAGALAESYGGEIKHERWIGY